MTTGPEEAWPVDAVPAGLPLHLPASGLLLGACLTTTAPETFVPSRGLRVGSTLYLQAWYPFPPMPWVSEQENLLQQPVTNPETPGASGSPAHRVL